MMTKTTRIKGMGISMEKLNSIINGRARDLCSPEGSRLIESKKSKMDGFNPSPSTYDTDADYFDSLYLNEDTSNRAVSINANSKMPDEIKKSMMEHPIGNASYGTSVLDELKPDPVQQKRFAVSEQRNIQSSSNLGGQVDYSIIKAIVNECLRDYFSTNQLNESAGLKSIGLQNGNITLIDNKGNIFQAKLQKIGNKNNRQQ